MLLMEDSVGRGSAGAPSSTDDGAQQQVTKCFLQAKRDGKAVTTLEFTPGASSSLKVFKRFAADLRADGQREAAVMKALKLQHVSHDGPCFTIETTFLGYPLHGLASDAEVKSAQQQLRAQLATAHALGLVHNDISMRNVLVDTQNNFHLIDWGSSTCTGLPKWDDLKNSCRSEALIELKKPESRPAFTLPFAFYSNDACFFKVMTAPSGPKEIDFVKLRDLFALDCVLIAAYLQYHKLTDQWWKERGGDLGADRRASLSKHEVGGKTKFIKQLATSIIDQEKELTKQLKEIAAQHQTKSPHPTS
jgi:hypothetical protein